ncbi:hypothetical protein ACS2QC_28325 [Bacillus cereus group sp. Bce033]|uniref:hypothetical protein n=1 Tax=Bacillus TaxID=1386 RepID=UPI000F4DB363|nr:MULTISPECIES: hypothetical protein [Bacillus]AYY30635.1 hypothetical protein EGX95_29955 [Bacillus sp. FDAARGOS_527]MBJ8154412.1 hypothetical protein [Bacillus cereus]MDA1829697.1 hypothetical protein [Bacillus cereus group sp. BY25LC]
MEVLKNHMKFKYVVPFLDFVDDKQISLQDLSKLLRENDGTFDKDQFIDDDIKELFPLNNFGDNDDILKVRGVSFVLENFIDEIESMKLDLSLSHNEIEFLGFNDENEMKLKFSNESIKGAEDIIAQGMSEGVYNSTNECFSSWFEMGSKHIDFCLKNSHKDKVEGVFSIYINEMLKALSDNRRQYRLLLEYQGNDSENPVYLLRGVTSKGFYKNYDNNVVLYLCLLFLHKYAVDTGEDFKFTGGYISDSEIKASFELEKPKRLKSGEEVYIGLLLSNNEIRKGVVSFKMYYRITDGKHSFKGIVKDSVCRISHSTGIEKLQIKLEELLNINKHEKKMLDYINRVTMTDRLSEDMIFSLFESIKSSELSSDTKSEAEKKRELLSSTMTIIQIFDRLSEITTDVNESIHLQRIYDDVIKSLSDKKE